MQYSAILVSKTMNTNLLAIVKQIVSTQGEDILYNPQRMKAIFSDLAKDEPKPDRIAFGRCIEHGFTQILKNASVTERDRCKQGLAQKLHYEEGIDLALCRDAVELLSAALFGEQQKKDYCKNCGKELQSGWNTCPYCAKTSQANTPAVSSGSGNSMPPAQQSYTPVIVQKKKTPVKNFFLFLLAAALLGVIGYFVVTNPNTNINLAVWKGYSSYASFSKAADIDEFLGEPLNEDGFQALMSLVLLASFYSDDDKISVDIVSGQKLTERYGVSESMRRDYNYLTKTNGIKGTTSYIAYFNGSNWIVLKYVEE